jgi:Protein of unknown function (DUF1236)
MNNRLFLSVAAAALIAGSGLAHAQSGMSREAPSAGAQSAPSRGAAPSADRAAPAERAAPANRDEATDTAKPSDASAPKAAQSDDKVQRDNGDQRATDSTRDNTKAPANKAADTNKPADAKAAANPADTSKTNADAKGADAKSATTGQAAAGGKLSTEQRTKISSVIKEQKVERVTNVNFSISVGTRVPRETHFHPLPAEIVTVYPDWRGYDFVLVNDQIIVVNPRTYEIVAVLDV